MKERLISVYDAARDDGGERMWPYIDYANTRISATVADEYVVKVTRRDCRPAKSERFDVRNVTTNVFLDRVARWLVTGEKSASDGSSDPLEW